MGDMGAAGEEFRIGSRDADRIPVRAAIEIRDGGRAMPAFAHDISITGLRIETRGVTLAAGDLILVRLPTAPCDLAAEIAWAAGRVAGAKFCQPLERDQLRTLALAMQPPEAFEHEPSLAFPIPRYE